MELSDFIGYSLYGSEYELRKIADDYNKNHINPPHHSPNLSLGSTRNGIGLAFNF